MCSAIALLGLEAIEVRLVGIGDLLVGADEQRLAGLLARARVLYALVRVGRLTLGAVRVGLAGFALEIVRILTLAAEASQTRLAESAGRIAVLVNREELRPIARRASRDAEDSRALAVRSADADGSRFALRVERAVRARSLHILAHTAEDTGAVEALLAGSSKGRAVLALVQTDADAIRAVAAGAAASLIGVLDESVVCDAGISRLERGGRGTTLAAQALVSLIKVLVLAERAIRITACLSNRSHTNADLLGRHANRIFAPKARVVGGAAGVSGGALVSLPDALHLDIAGINLREGGTKEQKHESNDKTPHDCCLCSGAEERRRKPAFFSLLCEQGDGACQKRQLTLTCRFRTVTAVK